jgi:chemotaxis signal transduction protein
VDLNRLNEVFRQRAQRLAQRGRRDATRTNRTPILVFRLGNERFGIELAHVAQVFPRVPITPLPGACGLLLGVAKLNGSLRTVIDPAALLNVPTTRSDAGYVVLLRASGKLLGLWAETLEGVCQIDLTRLAAVDEVASAPIAGFVRGTTDDRILVLDAKPLIEHVVEQRRQHAAEQ